MTSADYYCSKPCALTTGMIGVTNYGNRNIETLGQIIFSSNVDLEISVRKYDESHVLENVFGILNTLSMSDTLS